MSLPEYCFAKWGWTKRDYGEVSFDKGEMLKVIERNGEWSRGVFGDGRCGWFPAARVRPLTAKEDISALESAISAYEKEHGPIGEEEEGEHEDLSLLDELEALVDAEPVGKKEKSEKVEKKEKKAKKVEKKDEKKEKKEKKAVPAKEPEKKAGPEELLMSPRGGEVDGILFCRARWGWDAKANTELTMTKGQLLRVTKQQGEWWKGRTLDGQHGWFPSARVVEEAADPSSDEQKALNAAVAKVTGEVVPVVPVDGGEKGDNIKSPRSKKESKTDAKSPRLEKDSSSSRKKDKKDKKDKGEKKKKDTEDDEEESGDGAVYVRAKWGWKPRAEGELSFEKGDELRVSTKNNEWWKGRSATSGESGWFPSDRVRPITDAARIDELHAIFKKLAKSKINRKDRKKDKAETTDEAPPVPTPPGSFKPVVDDSVPLDALLGDLDELERNGTEKRSAPAAKREEQAAVAALVTSVTKAASKEQSPREATIHEEQAAVASAIKSVNSLSHDDQLDILALDDLLDDLNPGAASKAKADDGAAERVERERTERERVERERVERERTERERAERERREQEKTRAMEARAAAALAAKASAELEAEKARVEKETRERVERETRERVERETRERVERELEAERARKRAELEKEEKEFEARRAKMRAEAQALEAEQAALTEARRKREQEEAERKRREAEKAERARREAEKAAADQARQEREERARRQAEKEAAEKARAAAAAAAEEKVRIEAERAERQRVMDEKRAEIEREEQERRERLARMREEEEAEMRRLEERKKQLAAEREALEQGVDTSDLDALLGDLDSFKPGETVQHDFGETLARADSREIASKRKFDAEPIPAPAAMRSEWTGTTDAAPAFALPPTTSEVVQCENGRRTTLSGLERDVLYVLRRLHSDPMYFVHLIERTRLPFFDGLSLLVTNPVTHARTRYLTVEGRAAADDCIRDLRRVAGGLPLPVLGLSSGLTSAAKEGLPDHSSFAFVRKYGRFEGRIVECCAFELSTAEDIVLQLLIDDGDEGRTKRKMLLDRSYSVIGLAADTARCLIVFAMRFTDK